MNNTQFHTPSISSHIKEDHSQDTNIVQLYCVDTNEFFPYSYEIMQRLYDNNKSYTLINKKDGIK